MLGLSSDSMDILIRIIIASGLGGLIGLERDIRGRSAGLRTHLLVSTGAAVFMVLSGLVSGSTDGSAFTSDPGRIAAQIVTGIGFLGAGVIIKEGANIRGLTTAACLWSAAAIGMASGGGYYFIAVLTTLIALMGLILFKYFEGVFLRDSYQTLCLTTTNEVQVSQIVEIVKRKGLKILNVDLDRNYETGVTVLRISLRLFHWRMADLLAGAVISSLEASQIPLKQLRWDRT
jgi:putative Mg2+ transporter-C (MgtC) family protein